MTMAVRCSAEQIADFVVLLGVTGTFPEYCECADDARELKSLDLIISTMDAFVEAFCFSFEDIYRKYKINFPLSEEKFIEFLKPRCLLLTKDNSYFSFILVCAFVHDTIHSFSNYNKCFHLVKVASKCLAAILKNRFKKIFETDSAWEELITFCIKIHDLVYPPEKINQFDDNELVEAMIDKIQGLFSNVGLEFAGKFVTGDDILDTKPSYQKRYQNDDVSDRKPPYRKRHHNDNISDGKPKYRKRRHNDDDSDMKTTGKKFCTSLESDLATKLEVEKSEDLSILKLAASTSAPYALMFAGEGSLKFKSKEMIVDENNAKEDEKDCVKDSSLTDLVESLKNPGNLELPSTNASYTLLSMYKDSSSQNVTKKLTSSTDSQPILYLSAEESFLKQELEDNEKPFDIRCMSADEVCTRITDNPQHLLEIMKLLKICEEDIEPILFSPDEYDMLMNIDTGENEKMEASCGTSKSCSYGDEKILESIKTTIFYQNVKMANAMNKMFPGDNPPDDKFSGSEPEYEMSDDEASEYGNKIFEFDDPRCPLCVGGMDNIFDACVYNFSMKYSNNDAVSDLLRPA